MRFRLLVVDDNTSVCQYLGEALEERGYSVRVAGDGREALTLFAEVPADLIITDYEMPFLDGIALTRRIKILRPETVVLLLTGGSLPEVTAAAAAAGVREVIRKPFDLMALLERVEEIRREGRSSRGEEIGPRRDAAQAPSGSDGADDGTGDNLPSRKTQGGEIGHSGRPRGECKDDVSVNGGVDGGEGTAEAGL